MGTAIVLAVILSLGLFMGLPALLETILKNSNVSTTIITLSSGLLKILLLIGYMFFCGFVPDVRRTFQYHGAEHKSVHCNESGKPLTPENAAAFSRLHPRCGTAFLLIVFLISIILFLFMNQIYFIQNFALRFLFHLAMLPVIAGISYEVLMGLAHSDSRIACILRWPGMQMQRLTTREPDEKMLECAIVSVNVVLHGFPEGCKKTSEAGVFSAAIWNRNKGTVLLLKQVRQQTNHLLRKMESLLSMIILPFQIQNRIPWNESARTDPRYRRILP